MFSIDDSFELDDEAFLAVDVNIETCNKHDTEGRQSPSENDSRNGSSSSVLPSNSDPKQCCANLGSTVAVWTTMEEKSASQHDHSMKAAHSQSDDCVLKSESNSAINSITGTRNSLNQATANNNNNVIRGECTPSVVMGKSAQNNSTRCEGLAKKFNFKPLPKQKALSPNVGLVSPSISKAHMPSDNTDVWISTLDTTTDDMVTSTAVTEKDHDLTLTNNKSTSLATNSNVIKTTMFRNNRTDCNLSGIDTPGVITSSIHTHVCHLAGTCLPTTTGSDMAGNLFRPKNLPTTTGSDTAGNLLRPKHLYQSDTSHGGTHVKFNCDHVKASVDISKDLTAKPTSYVSVLPKKPVCVTSSTHSDGSTPGVGLATERTRKRKFPGPAGVLPQVNSSGLPVLNPLSSSSSNIMADIEKKPSVIDSDMMCSQRSEDKFKEGAWQTMKQDLEPQAQEIMQEFNIVNIIRKANKKLLPRNKVPVLCVIIDEISLDNIEASVILRDPTGKIHGTIHRLVVKEYSNDMQPGTVMVLRQVAVFSPSAARNHYLNITANNLVRIYSKDDDSSAVNIKHIANFEPDDFILPQLTPEILVSRSPAVKLTPSSHHVRQASNISGLRQTGHHTYANTGSPRIMTPTVRPISKLASVTKPLTPKTMSNSQSGNYNLKSTSTTSKSQLNHLNVYASSTASVSDNQNRVSTAKRDTSFLAKSATAKQETAFSAQSANHSDCTANLWQDDQLDELLGAISDDMIS